MTTTIEIAFKVLDSGGDQITSSSGIYPPLQTLYVITAFADGGDFTANTTNGGYDADAGDFTLGTAPGGNVPLNGGDFDTGAAVVVGEPLPPSGASLANGDTNPETELGVSVLDADDATISSDTLATPKGDISPQFEVIIEFALKPSIFLNLSAELVPQAGWDYNYIEVPLGTDIDMGTIVDPNNYTLDFGTITSPIEPALSSSVV